MRVMPSVHNIAPVAELIAAQARRRPDAPAIEGARDGARISFARLQAVAAHWERALEGVGSGSGRVAIDVEDPVACALMFLVVLACGRCAVPVDPHAPLAERERHVEATRPDLVVCDRPDRAQPAGLRCWSTGLVFLGVSEPRGAEAVDATVETRQAVDECEPTGQGTGAAGVGSVLLLTSGSTGSPKAVELDAARLLYGARAVAGHHQLCPDDRGYNSLPLWHINAEVVAVLSGLVAGATVVLDRRGRRDEFWDLVVERDITWINAVPALLARLVEEPPTRRPPRLRFVRSASAPLPAAVRERVHGLLGVPVLESYGMTEAASQITAAPLDGSGPVGSCGHAVAVSISVRSPDGDELPAGQIGQIWIRGPGVITGYSDGRGADRFDRAGWLQTGDMGWRDAGGYLFLVGRRDDVINRGGEMLYPREIEEVLVAASGVGEAVVVGEHDPVLGQQPVAYVVPTKAGLSGAAEQALRQRIDRHCAHALVRAKRPTAVRLVPELPRASTGKVQRHRLTDPGRGRV